MILIKETKNVLFFIRIKKINLLTQLKLCEGKTAAASAATAGGAGGAPAGMPDLSALAGMMGGMGGGAGGPGGGGIAAHMQLK